MGLVFPWTREIPRTFASRSVSLEETFSGEVNNFNNKISNRPLIPEGRGVEVRLNLWYVTLPSAHFEVMLQLAQDPES